MPIILIFLPENPSPPRHGAHLRMLQQISGLCQSAEVILLIPRQFERSNHDYLAQLTLLLPAKSIHQFKNSSWWYLYKCLRLLFFVPRRIAAMAFPGYFKQPSRDCCWKVMRYWIRDLTKRYRPNFFVINYSKYSWIIEPNTFGLKYVLELHDIGTINEYLQRLTMKQVKIKGREISLRTDYSLLSYVTDVGQLPSNVFGNLLEEMKEISKFDLVWSIGERESTLISSLNPTIKIKTILPAVSCEQNFNSKKASENHAILPIGPNIFNTYSLLRFLKEIEPYINYPDHSNIIITGSSWANMSFSLPERVSYLGLIRDYYKKLKQSRFVIAPTVVGTGQQVKIFEALSCGIPVICYRQAIPYSIDPLTNGLICVNNPTQFIDAINNAWHNEIFYKRLLDGAAKFSANNRKPNEEYLVSLKEI